MEASELVQIETRRKTFLSELDESLRTFFQPDVDTDLKLPLLFGHHNLSEFWSKSDAASFYEYYPAIYFQSSRNKLGVYYKRYHNIQWMLETKIPGKKALRIRDEYDLSIQPDKETLKNDVHEFLTLDEYEVMPLMVKIKSDKFGAQQDRFILVLVVKKNKTIYLVELMKKDEPYETKEGGLLDLLKDQLKLLIVDNFELKYDLSIAIINVYQKFLEDVTPKLNTHAISCWFIEFAALNPKIFMSQDVWIPELGKIFANKTFYFQNYVGQIVYMVNQYLSTRISDLKPLIGDKQSELDKVVTLFKKDALVFGVSVSDVSSLEPIKSTMGNKAITTESHANMDANLFKLNYPTITRFIAIQMTSEGERDKNRLFMSNFLQDSFKTLRTIQNVITKQVLNQVIDVDETMHDIENITSPKKSPVTLSSIFNDIFKVVTGRDVVKKSKEEISLEKAKKKEKKSKKAKKSKKKKAKESNDDEETEDEIVQSDHTLAVNKPASIIIEPPKEKEGEEEEEPVEINVEKVTEADFYISPRVAIGEWVQSIQIHQNELTPDQKIDVALSMALQFNQQGIPFTDKEKELFQEGMSTPFDIALEANGVVNRQAMLKLHEILSQVTESEKRKRLGKTAEREEEEEEPTQDISMVESWINEIEEEIPTTIKKPELVSDQVSGRTLISEEIRQYTPLYKEWFNNRVKSEKLPTNAKVYGLTKDANFIAFTMYTIEEDSEGLKICRIEAPGVSPEYDFENIMELIFELMLLSLEGVFVKIVISKKDIIFYDLVRKWEINEISTNEEFIFQDLFNTLLESVSHSEFAKDSPVKMAESPQEENDDDDDEINAEKIDAVLEILEQFEKEGVNLNNEENRLFELGIGFNTENGNLPYTRDAGFLAILYDKLTTISESEKKGRKAAQPVHVKLTRISPVRKPKRQIVVEPQVEEQESKRSKTSHIEPNLPEKTVGEEPVVTEKDIPTPSVSDKYVVFIGENLDKPFTFQKWPYKIQANPVQALVYEPKATDTPEERTRKTLELKEINKVRLGLSEYHVANNEIKFSFYTENKNEDEIYIMLTPIGFKETHKNGGVLYMIAHEQNRNMFVLHDLTPEKGTKKQRTKTEVAAALNTGYLQYYLLSEIFVPMFSSHIIIPSTSITTKTTEQVKTTTVSTTTTTTTTKIITPTKKTTTIISPKGIRTSSPALKIHDFFFGPLKKENILIKRGDEGFSQFLAKPNNIKVGNVDISAKNYSQKIELVDSSEDVVYLRGNIDDSVSIIEKKKDKDKIGRMIKKKRNGVLNIRDVIDYKGELYILTNESKKTKNGPDVIIAYATSPNYLINFYILSLKNKKKEKKEKKKKEKETEEPIEEEQKKKKKKEKKKKEQTEEGRIVEAFSNATQVLKERTQSESEENERIFLMKRSLLQEVGQISMESVLKEGIQFAPYILTENFVELWNHINKAHPNHAINETSTFVEFKSGIGFNLFTAKILWNVEKVKGIEVEDDIHKVACNIRTSIKEKGLIDASDSSIILFGTTFNLVHPKMWDGTHVWLNDYVLDEEHRPILYNHLISSNPRLRVLVCNSNPDFVRKFGIDIEVDQDIEVKITDDVKYYVYRIKLPEKPKKSGRTVTIAELQYRQSQSKINQDLGREIESLAQDYINKPFIPKDERIYYIKRIKEKTILSDPKRKGELIYDCSLFPNEFAWITKNDAGYAYLTKNSQFHFHGDNFLEDNLTAKSVLKDAKLPTCRRIMILSYASYPIFNARRPTDIVFQIQPVIIEIHFEDEKKVELVNFINFQSDYMPSEIHTFFMKKFNLSPDKVIFSGGQIVDNNRAAIWVNLASLAYLIQGESNVSINLSSLFATEVDRKFIHTYQEILAKEIITGTNYVRGKTYLFDLEIIPNADKIKETTALEDIPEHSFITECLCTTISRKKYTELNQSDQHYALPLEPTDSDKERELSDEEDMDEEDKENLGKSRRVMMPIKGFEEEASNRIILVDELKDANCILEYSDTLKMYLVYATKKINAGEILEMYIPEELRRDTNRIREKSDSSSDSSSEEEEEESNN